MPDRPLLPLPAPSAVALPGRKFPIGQPRFPSAARQRGRLGPKFTRLRDVLSRPDGVIELREDPGSLAPDRVIVFEIAGSVANFLKAISRIRGLEFMAEYENDFPPDEDFAVIDDRKGKRGQDRTDKDVPAVFYLAMPDFQALRQLVTLWDRWNNNLPLGSGFAPFANMFEQLRDLRPWGPSDRVPQETVRFWREELAMRPDRPVRTEIELWYYSNQARRQESSQTIRSLVSAAGGQIIHEATVDEVAYHGMLIDLPAAEIQALLNLTDVRLGIADDVMFLRPQSLLRGPMEIEAEGQENVSSSAPPRLGEPIAALFDGVPVQAHTLLAGRMILDDPDDLQSRAVVSRRIHGTAMASLIIHGDRNENGVPLSRPLYVRPLMLTDVNGSEHTDGARLLVDTIYRAILRMKGSEAEEAAAPNVFLVNLSIGDPRRPFSRAMSPLARLLDFLSAKYNVLFLVSGGNVHADLEIPDYTSWSDFESASPDDRERAVVNALHHAKHERTILSPAESLNALTIGAQHHDSVSNRVRAHNAVDPFQDNTLPNVSSGLGLGHRRMVKPDLYLPGGREFVRMRRTGGGLTVFVGAPGRMYGLSAAAPDVQGRGALDHVALSDGTSSATALATRTGHMIFDSLMNLESGSLLSEIDPQFYAVVVKALMVHTAKWSGNEELLQEICGPAEGSRWNERTENSSRFIGYGVPTLLEATECSYNRATLVGTGLIRAKRGHNFRIPLPECLEGITEPRSLSVTVAWFSPIRPGHQKYRCVKLEAEPMHPVREVLGVNRRKGQPTDAAVKRGSVFHEHSEGEAAVPYIDDGHLSLRVFCKEDAGLDSEEAIRYAIAITIQSDSPLPVYDQIEDRLRVRPVA